MESEIVVVYFTNENNVELAEMSASYFKKYSKNLKINIVSNRIPEGHVKKYDDIDYFDAGVEFDSSGKHFGETMITYLNSINHDYILLLCDDYVLIDDIKQKDLRELIQYISCEDIDYFGFDDISSNSSKIPKQPYKSSCKNKYSEHFILKNNDDEYLYSVQPSIWKRKSLLKILSAGISLHDLDHTIESLRVYKDIIALENSLKSHMTYLNKDIAKTIDYFIFAYVEIVRHGVFILPEINENRSEDEIQVKVIRDIINEYEFKNDALLCKLLYQNRP